MNDQFPQPPQGGTPPPPPSVTPPSPAGGQNFGGLSQPNTNNTMGTNNTNTYNQSAYNQNSNTQAQAQPPAPAINTGQPAQTNAQNEALQQLQQMIQMQQLQQMQEAMKGGSKKKNNDDDDDDYKKPNIQVNVNSDGKKIETNLQTKKIKLGRRHYIMAIALILSGIFFQLESFGVVGSFIKLGTIGQIGIADTLSIIILLIGVCFLFIRNKRARVSSVIIASIVIGLITAIPMYQSFFFGQKSVYDKQLITPTPTDLNQSHTLNMNTIWGDVILSGTTNQFLSLDYDSDRILSENVRDANGLIMVDYIEDNRRNILQRLRTDVQFSLNPNVPTDIFFKGFVSDYVIDLSQVNYQNASINAPYADVLLTLPSKSSEIEIKGRWVNTLVRVPANVGVEVRYERIMGGIELINFVETEDGSNIFQSLGYQNSAQKIVITTDGFYNTFNLERY